MVTPARDEAAVRRVLARVARRLWVWRVLRRFLRAAAAGSALVAALLLARPLGLAPDIRETHLLAVAAVVVGLFMFLRPRPVTPVQVAKMVDATYGLGERFTTAVECLGEPGAMHRLVVRDAARWGPGVDVRRVPRVRVGREAWAAGACSAAVAIVWLLPGAPAALSPAGPAMPRGQTAITADARAQAPRAGGPAPAPGGEQGEQGGLRKALGLEHRPTPASRRGGEAPGPLPPEGRTGSPPRDEARQMGGRGPAGPADAGVREAMGGAAAPSGAVIREGVSVGGEDVGARSGADGPGPGAASTSTASGVGDARGDAAAPGPGVLPGSVAGQRGGGSVG